MNAPDFAPDSVVDLSPDLATGEMLVEIEARLAHLTQREERILEHVEAAAAHREDVAALVERAQHAAGAVHERLGEAAEARAAVRAILEESQRHRVVLDERFAATEALGEQFEEVQKRHAALAKKVQAAATRHQKMTDHLKGTFKRLGGAKKIEALSAVPDRVREEAEAAAAELTAHVSSSKEALDAHVAELVATQVQELVAQAQRLLDAAREGLGSVEQRLADGLDERIDDRIQDRLAQGALAQQDGIDALRTELLNQLHAQKRHNGAIVQDLRSEMAAHREAFRSFEEGLRGHVEGWFEELARVRLRPQIEVLAAHVAQRDAQVEGRFETLEGAHGEDARALEQRIAAVERQAVRMRQRLVRARLAAAALVLVAGAAAWWRFGPAAAADVAPAPPATSALRSAAVAQPAAPAASEQPAAPAVGVPASGYVWVVGSVADRAAADAMCARYAERGADCHVYAASDGTGTRYRVGLGFSPDREAALAERDALGVVLPADAWLLRAERAAAR